MLSSLVMDTATKFKFRMKQLAFYIASIPVEKYESYNSPSNYGQTVGQTGHFKIGMATVQRERKTSELKTSSISLKNWPCVTSCPCCEGMNSYILNHNVSVISISIFPVTFFFKSNMFLSFLDGQFISWDAFIFRIFTFIFHNLFRMSLCCVSSLGVE